jgi:hypothetical protein
LQGTVVTNEIPFATRSSVIFLSIFIFYFPFQWCSDGRFVQVVRWAWTAQGSCRTTRAG